MPRADTHIAENDFISFQLRATLNEESGRGRSFDVGLGAVESGSAIPDKEGHTSSLPDCIRFRSRLPRGIVDVAD